MQAQTLDDLQSVLINFTRLLKKQPQSFLYQRENEIDPAQIDLSYTPVVARKVLKKIVRGDLCTLCENRISYKPNQFKKSNGKLPYLIILQNNFLAKKNQYFQDRAADLMFRKIISATLKNDCDQFVIHELLRCHFPSEAKNLDQPIQNCLTHIHEEIKQYNIKGILIMGGSAPLLFPNKQKLQNLIGNVFEFCKLPTVISPGPQRLTYMQQKGFADNKILEEKRKIFSNVNLFFKEVMT